MRTNRVPARGRPARGRADFIILIAQTDPDADPPQARNTAFIVPTSTPGFEVVRDVQTMGAAAAIPSAATPTPGVPHENILGGDLPL